MSKEADNTANSNSHSKYLMRQTTFEALIRSHEAEKDQQLLREIKEVSGYDFYRPKLQYSLEAYGAIVTLFCQKFYPQEPIAVAVNKIARRTSTFFAEGTLYGKVAWAAGDATSHQKLIKLLMEIHRAQLNYGQYNLEFPDERHALLTMIDDPSDPVYIVGMLQSLVENPNNQFVNAIVTYRVISKEKVVYTISWES